MKDNDKYMNQWNEIFSKKEPKVPISKSCGNEVLDKGIQWLCDRSKSILDFGCGNGNMLFLCGLNGAKYNIGIDFSEKAIENAKIIAKQMLQGEYKFIQGSIEALNTIEESSIDGVILSNIIDNLYPEDTEELLNEVERVLSSDGKILVKLNPYITKEQIKEFNIKVIKDDLLDDGLVLLNYTTEDWENLLKKKFIIKGYNEIYYKEFNQINRMFLLIKK